MSLTLPKADWPAQDRALWSALTRAGGPLDDAGALAHLRPTSLETLERRYARWLKWLAVTEPAVLALAPEDRASLPRLRAWLSALSHTAPMSRLMFVDAVLRVLRAAAPERDWAAQRRLLAGVKRQAGRGDPARKQGRILSSHALLEAGMSLATDGAAAASTPLQAMIRQRDGTMIALLALLPMRRRAFAALSLGTSLHVGETAITVALPGALTKSGLPWEADVPAPVEPVLRRYLAKARPFLLARGGQRHARLWITRRGAPMTGDAIGPRIAEVVQQLTGTRVPPHFFRDAAATTLARCSPEAARLIRPVLAHTGFGTAERHYIHARSVEAGRHYAALLARKKTETRP